MAASALAPAASPQGAPCFPPRRHLPSPRPLGRHRFACPSRGRAPFIGSALHGLESSGFVFKRASSSPRLVAPLLWPLLTSLPLAPQRISPGKNALLPGTTAAFTSTGNRTDFAVWCQLVARVGLSMRFLFIGSPLSHSLPSPGRLPSRSWLRMVISSCLHVRFSHRGLSPHLQRAHAGRTPCAAPDPARDTAFWDLEAHRRGTGRRAGRWRFAIAIPIADMHDLVQRLKRKLSNVA